MRPSTDWSEVVAPDEAQRHREFAEVIVKIQAAVDRKHGPGRAFHRKQVLGLHGQLTVKSGLPDFAAHGLFAEAAAHPVLVRLSGGSIVPQPDVLPDIRGFAFSVRGLSGPSALGGTTDRQDFVLINRPEFGFVTSERFADIVPAAAKGQTSLLKHFLTKLGPIQGPLEAAKLSKDLLRPFSGFATEDFFSAAPIACGPYAAKVRLRAHDTAKQLAAHLNFGDDLAKRLRERPVDYSVELQFFVSEERTPIENGMQAWSESDSPFVEVATLHLSQQDPDSEAGRELAEQINADRFDPWAALADHRPLGEIMRARKAAYFPSQKQRHATGT